MSNLFGQVNLIQRGLDTAWMRQEVISNNIANADTPGYKSRHVEFETELKNAMLGNKAKGWATHAGHFEIGFQDPGAVEPHVVTEPDYTLRMDENNVDPDQEMVELAANTISYNALVNQMNSEFSRLKTAISGNV